MVETKIQTPEWTKNQRALSWLSFAVFFIAFVLFFAGYAGNSWYVSPVVNYRYPPDNPIDPVNFGLFYLCFRGHCKYDLRQDYQIVKLLPPDLGITWAYQNYRTACMVVVTIAAISLLLALGSYLLFLSNLGISIIVGYITAGIQILAAVIALIGVIMFGKQFRGDVGVSPFGWSFGLVIVGVIVFLINGLLLILHTIRIHRHVSTTRYQAAGRSRSGGFLSCFQDCFS